MNARIVASAASFFVALQTTPGAADDTTGVRFQPPGHTFSVNLPSQPDHKRRSTSTVIGKVYTDVWGSRKDGRDYSIAITDLPSVALWFNSDEGLIEKARDKMLEELGARASGTRALDLGQFTQELDYFIPGQPGAPARRGRAWFALFDDKLVVISAVVPLGTSSALDRHFANVEPDVATIAHR